ncbi:MAG: galactose mutarotase [Clostridia bacterium]|nr:galactose mutarotase [Clostridia bacterium]
MSITRAPFGATKAGEAVERITMTNQGGAAVSLITYGGTLACILAPDRGGNLGDVCLGLGSVADYERAGGYLGALIGRYGNRIAGGRLVVGGRSYQLARNEGANHLHGGAVGFDKKVWTATCAEQPGCDSVALGYVSPDGEESFPGTLVTTVTYRWNDANELSIHYHAVSDRETVINLTNHAYFNLAGHAAGTIEDHRISIDADAYTPVDAACIPTGEIAPVAGTPFDLRAPRRIGDGIAEENEQLRIGHGYDHNFVLNHPKGGLRRASELYDPQSGRVMETFTDLPGLQFYAGNMLDIPFAAKDGARYTRRCGLCLETQYFPDTPNQPDFPRCTFRAGEAFDHTTVYKFSARGKNE